MNDDATHSKPRPRVLLVDDDASLLDSMRRLLSRDYEIEFPTERLLLVVGDTVEIADQSYRVREVIAMRDGNECRARLARL